MSWRVWQIAFRLAGAYALLIGGWWFAREANLILTPERVYLPPVDRAVWVNQAMGVFAAVLVALALVSVLRYIRRPTLHKYGTARWNKALTSAKVLTEQTGLARMSGPVRTDAEGNTLCILRLPEGVVVRQVQDKAEQIAASLHVPIERLHLAKHKGLSGTLLATIEPAPVPLKPRAPELDDRTSWRKPILLGRDTRGRNVLAPTYDVGAWLVGGINGSGKTTLLRLIAAHYALDPSAIIWGADGLSKRSDWGPLRDRCARWVDGADSLCSQLYLQMLRDAMEIILARNVKGSRDHQGMLLLLEEATVLRAGLNREDQRAADELLTRIVQAGRAANVLTVIAAQRPSSSLMSTNVRAQANIGICLRVRGGADAEMVLGYRPEVAMPDAPGIALVDTGGGEATRVMVDHLNDGAWHALCTQWERRPGEPVMHVVRDEPQDAAAPAPIDPLLMAVYTVVAAAPGQRLTTAGILAAGAGQGMNVAQLGRALSALGWPARNEWVDGRQQRMRYAADAPLDDSATAAL